MRPFWPGRTPHPRGSTPKALHFQALDPAGGFRRRTRQATAGSLRKLLLRALLPMGLMIAERERVTSLEEDGKEEFPVPTTYPD